MSSLIFVFMSADCEAACETFSFVNFVNSKQSGESGSSTLTCFTTLLPPTQKIRLLNSNYKIGYIK